MASSWIARLAHLALALLMVGSAVALTVPMAACAVTEAAPDEEEDCEIELAALAARTAHRPHRPAARSTLHEARTLKAGARAPRETSPSGITSADPLGARLRC